MKHTCYSWSRRALGTTASLLLVMFLSPNAGAVTSINHTNFAGDPGTVPVVDEDGNDIAPGTGTAAIGYFGSFSDAAISAEHGNLTLVDINALMSDFVLFGQTGAIGENINFNFPSTFDYNTVDDLTDQDAGSAGWQNSFADGGVGRNIYTVIGNVNSGGNGSIADLLNSSQVLVYKHDSTWTEEFPVGGPGTVNLSVDFSSAAGTLLLGGSFADTGYTTNLGGLLSSQTQAVALEGSGGEVIPEPSRAVLALLGIAVCGLRRRR